MSNPCPVSELAWEFIVLANPIGAVTKYEQDHKSEDKEDNYNQFSYGKANENFVWFCFERPKKTYFSKWFF